MAVITVNMAVITVVRSKTAFFSFGGTEKKKKKGGETSHRGDGKRFLVHAKKSKRKKVIWF